MRTTSMQRLSVPVLAMLLLIPAVPMGAEEPARASLQLELRAALDAQGSTFGLDAAPGASATTGESVAVEISPSELRATAWSLDASEGEPAEASAPQKKKGFGRWLKKRWYVVLLAAAVIGVAADSGGDNDASGEDD